MNLPFDEWLPLQRWYAGRSRELAKAEPAVTVSLRDDLDLVLLDVSYTDGTSERYQVIVQWNDAGPIEEYAEVAIIGTDGERTAYDALYDPAAGQYLLSLIDTSATVGAADAAVRFEKEPDATLPLDIAPRLMGAEQSNTSVVFEQEAVLKIFRRITPGINPDIELNRVLARAGNSHVAQLLGSFETTSDGEPCALGMVTAFAANSAEGWDMALASTRDLFAEGDLYADEVGGDFAGESFRLGEAVAAVHATLADSLRRTPPSFRPTPCWSGCRRSRARCPNWRSTSRSSRSATASSPRKRSSSSVCTATCISARCCAPRRAWLVIDFEGEPGQPLEERRRPDSPLRDVAGMLRSYEYAAFQRLMDQSSDSRDEDRDRQLGARAREWVDRNAGSFCEGYAEVSGSDPRDAGPLLLAYELDKAVYEAGYEARHRPSWLPIPLKSIARLIG